MLQPNANGNPQAVEPTRINPLTTVETGWILIKMSNGAISNVNWASSPRGLKLDIIGGIDAFSGGNAITYRFYPYANVNVIGIMPMAIPQPQPTIKSIQYRHQLILWKYFWQNIFNNGVGIQLPKFKGNYRPLVRHSTLESPLYQWLGQQENFVCKESVLDRWLLLACKPLAGTTSCSLQAGRIDNSSIFSAGQRSRNIPKPVWALCHLIWFL